MLVFKYHRSKITSVASCAGNNQLIPGTKATVIIYSWKEVLGWNLLQRIIPKRKNAKSSANWKIFPVHRSWLWRKGEKKPTNYAAKDVTGIGCCSCDHFYRHVKIQILFCHDLIYSSFQGKNKIYPIFTHYAELSCLDNFC